MNETQDSPGGSTATPPPPPPHLPPAGATGEGPRVSYDEMRDLPRLRRSITDRKIAGVAGGLGRHLDVDPTLIRVVFVVASFFGGAGLLLYGALWLLVPEEGRTRAAIATRDDTRKILLIGAGVVAGLIVLGHAWGNWWFGPSWPIGLIAVAAVVWLVTRDRRAASEGYASGTSAPGTYAPTSYPPTGYTAAAYVGGPGSGTSTGNVTEGSVPPPPPRPAWAPPPYVAPAPRPRRKGIVLFWPTLALVAIALGVLGLFAYNGTHVVDAAYPALALAIIGVMLVVGAFVGRPGGLIFIGIVSALAMAAASATGSFDSGKTLNYSPGSSSEVRSTYTFDNADLSLDLSRLSDPPSLDGRTVTVDGGAGRIEVVVPRDLNVVVDSEIRVVGGYQIGDFNGGGFGQTTTHSLAGTAGGPTLHLDLGLRVGEIDVRQQ